MPLTVTLFALLERETRFDSSQFREKIWGSLDSSERSSDTLLGEQKANIVRRLGSSALSVP